MRKQTLWLIIGLVLLPIAAGYWWHRHQIHAYTYKDRGRKEVRDAIAVVTRPGHESDCSGIACQTGYRLALIIYPQSELFYYQPAPQDLPVWKSLMMDTSASIYGRLCAAYFLLETDSEARAFLAAEAQHKEPRRRFNAATVLVLHLRNRDWSGDRPQLPAWATDLSLSLLENKMLDRIETEETRNPIEGGKGLEWDSTDILSTPIEDFCSILGRVAERRAIPVLMGVLERDPGNCSAALALAEIGDEKAIPLLLTILKSGTGSQDFDVIALGRFKCREAVPLLTARLGHPRSTFSGMDNLETRTILDALLNIGDKAAIAPIKAFLTQSSSAEQSGDAKRVLVQLEDDDPVPGLLAILHADGVAPAKEPAPSSSSGPAFKSEFPDEAFRKAAVLGDLCRYPDERVIRELTTISRTSESYLLRKEAISLLGFSKSPYAARELALLLDVQFPSTLKADTGLRQEPQNFNRELHEHVVDALKRATKKDFGDNTEAWTLWLDSHGSLSLPKPSQ